MKKIFIFLVLLIIPTISFAQAGDDVWTLWSYLLTIIKRLSQIAWVLTVVTFLFGLVQFLQKADDPKAQASAKELMKGSVIAFFIALTFWGLVTFVISSLSLNPDSSDIIPIISSRG